MAGITFRIDEDGIDALVRSAEMVAIEVETAQAIAAAAQGLAPVRTGRLKATYQVGGPEDEGADGVTVRAYTDHPAGHIIEWGGAAHPAFAPLRRAVDTLGLQFTVAPKGAA